MNERRARRGPPPGLTEGERREWFRQQARKFVWGPGDVRIIRRGGSEKPEGEEERARAGGARPSLRQKTGGRGPDRNPGPFRFRP